MLRLFQVMNRYKILIGIVIGLSILGGWVYSSFITPLYQASTVMIVMNSEGTKADYMEILANKQLVRTYSELVTSRAVLQSVVKELDFPTTVNDLTEAVSVRQLGDTEMMEITVLYPNSNQAARIANKTAEVFVRYLHNVLGLDNVKPIEIAVENGTPVSPDVRLNTILAGLIGFILIVTGCLIVDYVRQLYRQEDSIKGR